MNLLIKSIQKKIDAYDENLFSSHHFKPAVLSELK